MKKYKARWQPREIVARGLGTDIDFENGYEWFWRRQISETLRSEYELKKEMGIGRHADRLPLPWAVGSYEDANEIYPGDAGDDGDIPGVH